MGYVRLTEDQWEKPPFEFKVATGYAGRFTDGHKFGYNAAVGLSFEDIWSPGGSLSFLTSAEQMNIASTSAQDGVAGTGALTVFISGVDGNYDVLEETVTMNGVADVLTSGSFLRVNLLCVVSVGSNETNVGTITATAATAVTLQSQIDPDVGQALMAIMTVPNGKALILTTIQTEATGLDTAIIDLQTRKINEGWMVHTRANIPTAAIYRKDHMRFASPDIYPAKTDIKIRGIKASGAGTTIITGSFDYYLIDDREVRS